jgi:integrase
LKTAWHTAKKAAKVKARWHDLHHTAVTWLLENGQTLPIREPIDNPFAPKLLPIFRNRLIRGGA